MSEVMVANQDAAVMVGDVPHVLQKGVTMARDTHPIVKDYPSLWKPLDVHYDVDEPEPPAKPPAKPAPAARK